MEVNKKEKKYHYKECPNCGEMSLIELQEWNPLELYAFECEECDSIFERKQV